jgi:hypothetical protein
MPTVVYRWDFETGDTQGWTLESYVTLDNSGALQGTYSLYTDSIKTGKISAGTSKRIAYITNIDLSAASRPLLVFLVRARAGAYYNASGIRVVVKDSAGNTLLDRISAIRIGANYDVTKAVSVDLSAVAGRSGLTIEIYWYAYGSDIVDAATNKLNIDNIYIIDGGDKEYDIALLALNNMDRTITYSIPEADRALPSGVARFSIALATPPHPLNEDSDVFTYAVYCDQGSASITSTDKYYTRHVSDTATPTTPPSYVNELRVRAFPTTAGSTWYSFDEKVVVTFWSAAWELLHVVVFNVAITINPYSPTYATAMINTTYGSTWAGQREFTVKVHARSLGIRCYVRYLVGDNTIVQAGTVKVEVFSEDYSVKYGESSVDLTTGTVLRGSVITGLPVDTTLKLRISWSITATARVVLEVRPEFIVY